METCAYNHNHSCTVCLSMDMQIEKKQALTFSGRNAHEYKHM